MYQVIFGKFSLKENLVEYLFSKEIWVEVWVFLLERRVRLDGDHLNFMNCMTLWCGNLLSQNLRSADDLNKIYIYFEG